MLKSVDLSLPFALFDDSMGDPGHSMCRLYWDIEEVIAFHGRADVESAMEHIESVTRAGRHVAILATYELGYLLEPGTLERPNESRGSSLIACVFRHAGRMNGRQVAELLDGHIQSIAPGLRVCGVAGLRFGIEKDKYLSSVGRILDYIVSGDCYQVNFTFPLRFVSYGDHIALYARLRRAQPVRHGALIRLPDRDILSLSPELFIQRTGNRLTTRPMKGTMRRDDDPSLDDAQRMALLTSGKNRAENLMIVDLIRSDLGRIAVCGSVSVDRLMDAEAYPTVWQMTSTISAEAPDASLAQVFRALFPCGSVTGAPKIRAMQIIAELEASARGIYTGAIGWIQADGDFAFNVPIRTLSIDAEGLGTLGIGSGIVADSDPNEEFGECLLKAGFLTGLGADFELIETLLFDPLCAGGYPLLEDHMSRLAASARYFAFRCDTARIAAALFDHGRSLTAGMRHRTRLLLGKDGNMHIESTPLADGVMSAGSVVLARGAIDSRDIFRRHKTTVRFEYDAELDRLKETPDVADAIFRNERGELSEGGRTNIYLEFGGVLHTPPVSAGLLDGVMRRRLFREKGALITERSLTVDDLSRADAIYLSNAIRGLRRVNMANLV